MKVLKISLLVLVAIILFALYSFLPLSQLFDSSTHGVHFKFDTPDEMINYSFALNFQKTNRLYYVEYLNEFLAYPIVFPRWARTDGGFMYPGTFLGAIILFGSVAKVFGTLAMTFVTPLVAIVFLAIFYFLIKNIFDKRVALLSVFVISVFPVFLYYASRTMFHTMLFLFFVLLAVWLYVKAFEEEQSSEIPNSKFQIPNNFQFSIFNFQSFRTLSIGVLRLIRNLKLEIRNLYYYLSALSFGLALFIRFADIWWVVLTIVALFIYQRMDLKRNVLYWLIFFLSLFPTFYLNNILYGNWLDFGYPLIANEETQSSQGVLAYFLPFGFHPRVIWNVSVNVLLKPYLVYWFIGLLGYVFVVKDYWKTNKKEITLFTVSCFLFAVYLLSFYGSWQFSDSIDPTVIAISSSYYRYFLPLFVLVIPFMGYLVAKLFKIFRVYALHVTRYAFGGGLIVGMLLFTFWYAYISDEGLFHVRRQVLWYRAQTKILQSRGASYNDLFLVKRGQDKVLFPEFPKVVNIDYIDPQLVEESMKKYRGVVWKSKNGAFQKQVSGR